VVSRQSSSPFVEIRARNHVVAVRPEDCGAGAEVGRVVINHQHTHAVATVGPVRHSVRLVVSSLDDFTEPF
jgi:hypothetical protein